MGCFNSTGFISKLPICHGDRVVCFIGVEAQHIGGHELFYPSDVVAPYFLPIYGEYNDYGSIENIDRTPIVEFLEKFAGCSIEDIVNGIERCLYGNTINENIAYWGGMPKGYYPEDKIEAVKMYLNKHGYMSSDKVENMTEAELLEEYDKWQKDIKDPNGFHGENVLMYSKLLPLFKSYYNRDGGDVQPVLMFEHEDVYNKLTTKEYVSDEWFNKRYDLIDRFSKFYEKLNKRCKKLVELPFSITGGYHSSFNELRFEVGVSKKLVNEYSEMIDYAIENNIHSLVGCSQENHSLFGLFDEMTLDETLDILLTQKEEIKKFCNLYYLFAHAPMYFGFSKTSGEQWYTLQNFKDMYTVIGEKLDELIEKDKEYEDEDEIDDCDDEYVPLECDKDKGPINGGGA